MVKKIPDKKKKRTKKNPLTKRTLTRMVKYLDDGNILPVKKFLLDLIPTKTKSKKTIRGIATEFRYELVKNATKEELLTRDMLKEAGVTFRFQYVVFVNKSKFYIVDFYIAKLKLAIELDGFHHHATKQREKDLNRTEELNAKGVTVVRFNNCETLNKRKFQQKLLGTIKKFEGNLQK